MFSRSGSLSAFATVLMGICAVEAPAQSAPPASVPPWVAALPSALEAQPVYPLVSFRNGAWADPVCESPLPATSPSTARWESYLSFLVGELGNIIERRRGDAVAEAGAGAPPKWWRDLLASYADLVSYSNFKQWDGALAKIGGTRYKGQFFCFTSGDRGGYIVDQTFPEHLIVFAMGTQTEKQMNANKDWLGRNVPLEQAIFGSPKKYGFFAGGTAYARPNAVPRRLCGGLPLLGGGVVTSAWLTVRVSLGGLRAVHQACGAPLDVLMASAHAKHLTVTGHSRGGLIEPLAAVLAVTTPLKSMRVVGLGTPATSTLWLLAGAGARLPGGGEFTRVVVQNQSSGVAGVGADQVPRMESTGQWLKRSDYADVYSGFGEQPVSYLRTWAYAIANGTVPNQTAKMLERAEGNTLGMFATWGLSLGSQNFAGIAWPHWAGVYAAGLIGQYYWVADRSEYRRFLRVLSAFQGQALEGVARTARWPPSDDRGRQMGLFYMTAAGGFADAAWGPQASDGALWGVVYMSEAALAAAQYSDDRVLPDRFHPYWFKYHEALGETHANWVDIRAAASYCQRNPATKGCDRWNVL